MYRLRLYVSGNDSGVSEQVARLRALLDDACPGTYELDVRDLFEHPLQAHEDTVYATPTLLRLKPPPPARIIGDFSDRERVIEGLALAAAS